MVSIAKKKTKGIVIKTSDYKDNALIVHLLTSKGLEDYICRGAKKVESKMRHLTQELTYIEVVVTNNKTLNTITEGEVLENFTIIKDNTEKLLVGMTILESINSFKDHIDNYETLFNFTLFTLNFLKTTDYSKELLNVYDIKLTYLLGIAPLFSKCVNCGNDGKYMSIQNGGLLCDRCKNDHVFDLKTSEIIRLIFNIKPNKINDEFLNFISEYQNLLNIFVKEYYISHLSYTNKMRQISEKLA